MLLHEAIECLHIEPGKTYLDATLGGGGHARAMLQAEPTCRLIACDWDARSLEEHGEPLVAEFPDRVTLIWTNFSQIGFQLKRLGITSVQGILADFGTSRFQIEAGAGFSCARNTPLDMRMSPAHQQTTAAMIIGQATAHELTHIIGTYGEERHAKHIAETIVAKRMIAPLRTTADLAQLIEVILPHEQGKIHPATRTFQALRIVVNKELENISGLLAAARTVLASGGRMVCISFHSLEDRLVKREFTEKSEYWQVITPRGITASTEEITANPSSRSARLRAAVRC